MHPPIRPTHTSHGAGGPRPHGLESGQHTKKQRTELTHPKPTPARPDRCPPGGAVFVNSGYGGRAYALFHGNPGLVNIWVAGAWVWRGVLDLGDDAGWAGLTRIGWAGLVI